MDSLTAVERSALMRRIGSRDTGPELLVRRLAHRLGYRFRLYDARLPGHPDLVFPSRCKAIFVHGCFWHRHNRCSLARPPKTRRDFWLLKLERNKTRDAANRRALTRMGWSSLVVWQCELSNPAKAMVKLIAFLED